MLQKVILSFERTYLYIKNQISCYRFRNSQKVITFFLSSSLFLSVRQRRLVYQGECHFQLCIPDALILREVKRSNLPQSPLRGEKTYKIIPTQNFIKKYYKLKFWWEIILMSLEELYKNTSKICEGDEVPFFFSFS